MKQVYLLKLCHFFGVPEIYPFIEILIYTYCLITYDKAGIGEILMFSKSSIIFNICLDGPRIDKF